MQGLMWRAVNLDGTLTYSFVESVKASYPFWAIRFLGGVLFLVGHVDHGLQHGQDDCRWSDSR
jgi:cbb3-type cytochrome oxidase subunit 1